MKVNIDKITYSYSSGNLNVIKRRNALGYLLGLNLLVNHFDHFVNKIDNKENMVEPIY